MSWNVVSDFMKTKNRVKGLDLFSFLQVFFGFSSNLISCCFAYYYSSLGAKQLQKTNTQTNKPNQTLVKFFSISSLIYLFLHLLNKAIWLLNSHTGDSRQLTTLKLHNIKTIPPPHHPGQQQHNQANHLINSIYI